MDYRKFGKIDFDISVVSFGGASVSGEGKGYGFGAITEEKSIELIQYAYDRGINSFDTAPIYGFRTSEIRFGKALKNIREKVFITSKCGVSWHDNGRVDMNNDPKIAQKMLDQSLKDLQSDYIDLYMIHWPDEKWDIRYPLEVLFNNQSKGKIKHIGLCNTNLDDFNKASEICSIDVIQSEFNLFNRSLIDLLDSINLDVGVMSWGTLDKGILSKTVDAKRTYDQFDCRKSAPWWKKEDVLRKVNAVQKLDMNSSQLLALALGHNLSFNKLSTALVGTKSIEQIDSLLEALKNLPSDETIQKTLRILNE